MQMRESLKKGTLYVLIPLSTLAAGYGAGRINQLSRDLATVGKLYLTSDNPSVKYGEILVAKGMADKNPAVFGLAQMVEQASRNVSDTMSHPNHGEIHDMLEDSRDLMVKAQERQKQ